MENSIFMSSANTLEEKARRILIFKSRWNDCHNYFEKCLMQIELKINGKNLFLFLLFWLVLKGLTEEMYDDGYHSILNIDYAASCIKAMEDKYREYEHLSCMKQRKRIMERGMF
eukprot:GHVT01101093.1.p2 GENE.GHVT01101093.1~~GHVT01101093.1.p2  ORF type:complete len:114 (-),score=9.65 GHVT01101093.1:159-500(-)